MQRLITPVLLALCLAFSHWAAASVPRTVEQLNGHPPRIVVSRQAARLMLIDGPPVRVAIPATRLEFVVNTDWDVFHDRGSDRWYVLDGAHWLEGNMLSSGDWRSTTALPRDFLTLQVSSDWPQVAAAMPPAEPPEPPARIVVSYEPTELIVVDGDMQFEDIGGGLQYVSNTGSDLFFLDGRYYYRAAGRWFTTKDVDRKWYPVKSLPRAFAEIPADHPRGRVLESVPGTEAARLAAAEAAAPKRREIDAAAGRDLVVPWFGEPSFVVIEGTDLQRGENTPFQVIRHNNYFYLCHEAAWFSSTGPQGPWRAAREIPQEIYSIPATDPAFNVTFVRADTFDDETGRMAYVSTSGYYNRYYNGSTMVYGTGWYYPGYYRGYAYWRYPYTYGYYGPWSGWYPYATSYSETFDVTRRETDWEWGLDGSKRRVYRYGPQDNTVGGTYVMPESDRPGRDRRD